MNELHKERHAHGELDSTIYKNLKRSMKLKKNYSQKMKINHLVVRTMRGLLIKPLLYPNLSRIWVDGDLKQIQKLLTYG